VLPADGDLLGVTRRSRLAAATIRIDAAVEDHVSRLAVLVHDTHLNARALAVARDERKRDIERI
jgi:hypothetical protein